MPSGDDSLVDLPAPFVDARGVIQTLVRDKKISTVQLITSKAGSIRANHYHKTDWHYMYVVSGTMTYFYRPAGSKAAPSSLLVQAGQLIYTPSLIEHAVEYHEDSAFINIAGGPRDQAAYESDLVRVELIKPKS